MPQIGDADGRRKAAFSLSVLNPGVGAPILDERLPLFGVSTAARHGESSGASARVPQLNFRTSTDAF